jgi:flotillin
MVRQVMEGHLHGIVGQLTVEQLVKDPELVPARMWEIVATDLDKRGLEVVPFDSVYPFATPRRST